jgi:uncharacterized protein YggL (DUF469 family)
MLRYPRLRTLFLLGLTVFPSISGEEQVPQKMTVEEASKLVNEVARVHNAGAEVSKRRDAYDSDFFYFEIIVPNQVASPVVGHFAVNPWTGDVWNPGLCERVTSPSLKKMQRRVRTKLHISEKEYQKLRQRKPICS